MKKIVVIGLFLLIFAGFSVAQTNSTDLLSLIVKKNDQEKLLLDGYGKSLALVMADLKKKGDIDTYLIVEKEKKRVEKEKTVPVPADTKDAFKVAANGYYKAKVTLLERYILAVDNFIRVEMDVDRMDDAKEGKAEKDKAVIELADLKSKMPKEKQDEAKTNIVNYPKVEGTWIEEGAGSFWVFTQKTGGILTVKGHSSDNSVTYEGTGRVSITGEVIHSIHWLKNPGKFKNSSRSFKISEDGMSMMSTSNIGLVYIKKELR